MTSVIPGLIKIGKTRSDRYLKRMYDLEHDGYRNVTGLKRVFAIEVDDYDEKEELLHTIFAKSRVADTELFALDKNTAMQLLTSFDGTVVYPEAESKSQIFGEASEHSQSRQIPNGEYHLEKKKVLDGSMIQATAIIQDGKWTLLKGSTLGIAEGTGVPQKAKSIRATLPMDSKGRLFADVSLGECSPSFVGAIVTNQSTSGWIEWKTVDGKPIDIYRKVSESD